MKHGDPGYVFYDEPYRFLDETGHQVIEGSDEIWSEHGLEAVKNLPLGGIQEKMDNLDIDEESSVCSVKG
jgi:hypothetical protein